VEAGDVGIKEALAGQGEAFKTVRRWGWTS